MSTASARPDSQRDRQASRGLGVRIVIPSKVMEVATPHQGQIKHSLSLGSLHFFFNLYTYMLMEMNFLNICLSLI